MRDAFKFTSILACLLVGCEAQKATSMKEMTMRAFRYEAYDDSNELKILGILVFADEPTTAISGYWAATPLNAITSETKDGRATHAQAGSGMFEGTVSLKSIELSFGPAIDNEIVVHGRLTIDQIVGTWEHHTDAGVEAQGLFKAWNIPPRSQ